MSDDQALLLRYASSRDAEAFAKLVKRYSTLVFSVASRVTGNTATAEDVTQDCFMKLACQADSIHGSLPGWLHRAALNRSMQVTRNEATRLRHEIRVTPPSDPDYETSWNQIAPLIDAALAKIPDDLREPLVQHFLLDRTQTEVAENLRIDQGTVSRRLQEGIKKIREHLKNAGVVCGSTALSTIMVKNASAAVPARLAASLAKMAIAGPAKITATASAAAILAVNAKLIAAIATVVVVGTITTYHFVLSPTTFTPQPYLSKLNLQGNGFTNDSFSLAFQAAAKVLGRDADYETVYALSTNAFSPVIEYSDQGCNSYWQIGNEAIKTLGARYGLNVRSLEIPGFSGNTAAYRNRYAPIILQAIKADHVVIVTGRWKDNEPYWPWAGIVTYVQSDNVIIGATLNGRVDNQLTLIRGIWSLEPAAVTLTPHEADIATLRSAVARIRDQSPFQATPQAVYGLQAMDAGIKAMSETPGFCTKCVEKVGKGNKFDWSCAHIERFDHADRLHCRRPLFAADRSRLPA